MKFAYVRTGGGGGGVQTNAYALRTGGRGGQKLANFAYVLYGWPPSAPSSPLSSAQSSPPSSPYHQVPPPSTPSNAP